MWNPFKPRGTAGSVEINGASIPLDWMKENSLTDEQRLARNPVTCSYHTINGRCYKRDESGKWIKDEEANRAEELFLQRQIDRNKKNADLIFAMSTRILTDEEAMQVYQLGPELLVVWDGHIGSSGMTQKDVIRRLQDLYFQQFRFRAVAAQIAKDAKG